MNEGKKEAGGRQVVQRHAGYSAVVIVVVGRSFGRWRVSDVGCSPAAALQPKPQPPNRVGKLVIGDHAVQWARKFEFITLYHPLHRGPFNNRLLKCANIQRIVRDSKVKFSGLLALRSLPRSYLR